MNTLDLSVSFPSRGVIRLQSRSLFEDADDPTCRRFLERVFQAEEISNVTISGGDSPRAELRYCPKTSTLQDVVKRIVAFLSQGSENGSPIERPGPRTSQRPCARATVMRRRTAMRPRQRPRAVKNGHVMPHLIRASGRPHAGAPARSVASAATARDKGGVVRYYRHDSVVTGWEIKQRPARPAPAEEPGPLPQERSSARRSSGS